MEKCPDCHKYFERNWKGQEYCPKCGQTKEQAIAKKQRNTSFRRPAPSPTPKAAPRSYTAAEAFTKRLIERMYTEHGIEHHPTVFRNRRTSYAHMPNGKTQIVLGYESVERAERGFQEYKTISWVWNGQGRLEGLRGAWALALHEFAHVRQFVEDRLFSQGHRNKYHNDQFVEILEELQILYPFEECK